MLGFFATAVDDRITVDGEELADAQWFTREGLTRATTSAEVVLPPRTSISRRLIDAWHGGDLPQTPFL
jgi:NAD+ diphosphatase